MQVKVRAWETVTRQWWPSQDSPPSPRVAMTPPDMSVEPMWGSAMRHCFSPSVGMHQGRPAGDPGLPLGSPASGVLGTHLGKLDNAHLAE